MRTMTNGLLLLLIAVGCDSNSVDGDAGPTKTLAGDRVRVVVLPDGGSVPDAEIDSEGVIHVAYLANDNVYYVQSADDCRTFSAPIRVNSQDGFAMGGAFRGPDLALGKGNRVHVIWYNQGYQQERPHEEWGVNYARLNLEEMRFETTRNLNQRPSDNFSLAADESGRVAVIWMADGVFATISRNGGDDFEPAVDLSADPCECCGSRAIYQNEMLAVLYRDKADNDRDTFLAFSGDESQQFTHSKVSQSVWQIESCPMTGSFLGTAIDGLVAGWETKGQIYFAKLRPDGSLQSDREILVSTAGRYPVVLAAQDQTTLVAWKNGTEIQWQLFNADESPVGETGSQLATTPDRPGGVVTQEGKFLLFP